MFVLTSVCSYLRLYGRDSDDVCLWTRGSQQRVHPSNVEGVGVEDFNSGRHGGPREQVWGMGGGSRRSVLEYKKIIHYSHNVETCQQEGSIKGIY